MSMIVKVHKKENRTGVAVCDKDLLGQLIEEDGKQIDLTGEFYNGNELTLQETGDLIRNADVLNLVGEEAVKLALDEGLIEEEHIIRIKGVPHAQAVLIHD